MPRKPTPMYRTLLREAFSLAWERKSLWVFGLFAGLVSTGGLFDAAYRSFRRIEQGSDLLMTVVRGSVPGYDTFGSYVQNLLLLDRARVTATITVAALIVLLLAVTAVLSQGALIAGLLGAANKAPHRHLNEGRPFFWRILLLDLAAKAMQLLLIFATTLPLVLFLTRTNVLDGVLYTAVFLVLFPATVIVSLLLALASIDVVKEDAHPVDAIHRALIIFGSHWLVALELGIAVFLVVAAAGFAGLCGIILLSIPYAVLIGLSIYAGSPFLFSLVSVLAGVLLAVFLFTLAGAVITFQHAVWLKMYERAGGGRRNKLVAKLERLWMKW
jgi:hypothetical protein